MTTLAAGKVAAAGTATLVIIGPDETCVVARDGDMPLVYTPRGVANAGKRSSRSATSSTVASSGSTGRHYDHGDDSACAATMLP